VNRTAIRIAVVGLVVLAIVGTASGVPPAACSLRALVGAAILYFLARVAGGVLISVAADVLHRSSRKGEHEGKGR
jgi:hypothetical protein